MRWLSSFVVALVATAASAAPVAQSDDSLAIYKLKIAAHPNTFLDGKYLSVRGDKVGVWNDNDPLSVYTSPSPSQGGLVQLHKWPAGVVDSVLGLVGTGGLTTLTEISSPDSITYPVGTVADWKSWALIQGPAAGAANKRAAEPKNLLDYAGSRTGRWAAFPRANKEWVVTWLEGTTYVPENYMAVDVVYEPVNA
ncbi:hypothetical protein GGTG_10186 [Gaeumannomyces tritici R3-111a-1]|uniref:Uncharacterized protein n=1 Tax=Gaeumannomyces tritici (strain R3-111a-1) TaxID=644352 RepID=J3P9K6_GAET3|nr:hypothetical protein GGTG_10186 [Gaeumannomyces tritici R3-111a-1]EJT73342.1 hypothetical protein GGTG_10186 [Gaeumannomyces tritici R3-111a-1]